MLCFSTTPQDIFPFSSSVFGVAWDCSYSTYDSMCFWIWKQVSFRPLSVQASTCWSYPETVSWPLCAKMFLFTFTIWISASKHNTSYVGSAYCKSDKASKQQLRTESKRIFFFFCMVLTSNVLEDPLKSLGPPILYMHSQYCKALWIKISGLALFVRTEIAKQSKRKTRTLQSRQFKTSSRLNFRRLVCHFHSTDLRFHPGHRERNLSRVAGRGIIDHSLRHPCWLPWV